MLRTNETPSPFSHPVTHQPISRACERQHRSIDRSSLYPPRSSSHSRRAALTAESKSDSSTWLFMARASLSRTSGSNRTEIGVAEVGSGAREGASGGAAGARGGLEGLRWRVFGSEAGGGGGGSYVPLGRFRGCISSQLNRLPVSSKSTSVRKRQGAGAPVGFSRCAWNSDR